MTIESRAATRQAATEAFQRAFWGAKKAIAEATAAAFRRHGVWAGQQFVLRCLWEEDGLTPGEIAHRLELATPTVTKATSRMESAGLLIRRPHPSDKRLVRIHLTRRGKSLQHEIGEEVERLTERALQTLGPTERRRLVDWLSEIRQNLGAGPDRSSAPPLVREAKRRPRQG